MRFYYQAQDLDSGQKVATKCIRVSSTATNKQIIETLIEKFRPDMKMLEVPEYALYEIHESGMFNRCDVFFVHFDHSLIGVTVELLCFLILIIFRRKEIRIG